MCRHPNGLLGMDILPLHLVQDGLRYGTQTDSCLKLGLCCLDVPWRISPYFHSEGIEGTSVFIKLLFLSLCFPPYRCETSGRNFIYTFFSRFPPEGMGMCKSFWCKKIFVKYINISVDSYVLLC